MSKPLKEVLWYRMTIEDVARQQHVNPVNGLTDDEVRARIKIYGYNRLAGKKKESSWHVFLRQYGDFMQIILLVAGVISLLLVHQIGSFLVLIGLTVFNAVLGMNQESKAEASLASLQKMMKNIARVRRDGQVIEVDADEIVPGDIVLLEAGNRVPYRNSLIA